mmetsp:Transcript_45528/g.114709  ORF Transcript_45528/g.114709 Transcript_45528/m.114709 type:complete len:230 (+) Transcript_45528:548-1237(+)
MECIQDLYTTTEATIRRSQQNLEGSAHFVRDALEEVPRRILSITFLKATHASKSCILHRLAVINDRQPTTFRKVAPLHCAATRLYLHHLDDLRCVALRQFAQDSAADPALLLNIHAAHDHIWSGQLEIPTCAHCFDPLAKCRLLCNPLLVYPALLPRFLKYLDPGLLDQLTIKRFCKFGPDLFYPLVACIELLRNHRVYSEKNFELSARSAGRRPRQSDTTIMQSLLVD